MLEWLLRIKGLGAREAAQYQDAALAWSPSAWWGLVSAVLLGAAILVLRRQRHALAAIPVRSKWLLVVTRASMVSLALLLLARPHAAVTQTLERRARVAVLVDDSTSMGLPAGLGESSPLASTKRLDFARELLRERGVLDALLARFDVRLYRAGAQPGPMAGVEELRELKPSGTRTALGSAMRKAVDDAAGERLSAIVLLSDGRGTSGPDPVQVARSLGASGVGQVGTPIFTVPPGGVEAALDVELVQATAPTHVALNDTASVVALVASRGYAGTDARLTLLHRGASVDHRTLRLADGVQQQVRLAFHAREAGSHALRVRVDPLPREQVPQNNERTVRIEVGSDKRSVLVLEGHPRWDFRFLDHALKRDTALQAVTVMESQLLARGVAPAVLPEAAGLPKDRAGFAAHALVVLGDISPDLLPPPLQGALSEAVEKDGVGLLIHAGERHMPTSFVEGPMKGWLPVRWSEDEPRGRVAPDAQPFAVRLTAPGMLHGLFELPGRPASDRSAWQGLPPLSWVAGAAGAKPGATVLAEVAGDGRSFPLVVEHRFGAGRVLYIGSDETYRWRRNLGGEPFYRFWGQALRHAARDRQRSDRESWIEATPVQAAAGEEVQLTLFALDAQGKPLLENDAKLTWKRSGRESEVAAPTAGQPGLFKLPWTAAEPGDHEFIYAQPGKPPLTAQVTVLGAEDELLRPVIDRAALSAIAEASSGELVEPDRLLELVQRIPASTVRFKRSLESPLWDHWLALAALVGLYLADIAIRRGKGLT